MKINWRMVQHLIFLLSFAGVALGTFEHNLQLQPYKRMYEDPTWHWFWGTQIRWLPHHQWISIIFIGITYLFLCRSDYIIDSVIKLIYEAREEMIRDDSQ